MTTQTAKPLFPVVSTRSKDLGVALLLLLALAGGFLLRAQVTGRSVAFADPDSPFALRYPAGWIADKEPEGLILRASNPLTDSAFKTTLSVLRRDLDPASPPTLQILIDRQVEEHATLTGYHLLAEQEVTLSGLRGALVEFAYVVQPIDQPRRATLPVVVRAREYIVVAKDRSYVITLAAPESADAEASAQLDTLIKTVTIQ